MTKPSREVIPASQPEPIRLTEDEIWYLLEEVHIPHTPECNFWTVSAECSDCISGTIREKLDRALPSRSPSTPGVAPETPNVKQGTVRPLAANERVVRDADGRLQIERLPEPDFNIPAVLASLEKASRYVPDHIDGEFDSALAIVRRLLTAPRPTSPAVGCKQNHKSDD